MLGRGRCWGNTGSGVEGWFRQVTGGSSAGPRVALAVIVAVALGGGLGALLRVVVGGGLTSQFPSVFPWGTLLVNFGGSFVLGFSDARLAAGAKSRGSSRGEAGAGRRRDPGGSGGTVESPATLQRMPSAPGYGPSGAGALRAFLIPGLCGGFTTFSAFSIETLLLVEAGRGGTAALYLLVSVGVCVAGVIAGRVLGRRRG